MESSKTKWTKEFISEKLQNLNLRGEKISVANISEHQWAYRKSAAVLSFFNPGELKPFDQTEESPQEAVELLADSTIVYDEENRPRWMLRNDVRREALQQLSSREAMMEALKANAAQPQDALQKMLASYIRNDAPPIEKQTPTELSNTLQVTEWLEGILENLPDRGELRRRIEIENLLKPFKYLVGDHFRGRSAELQKLRDYVGVFPPSSTFQSIIKSVKNVLGLSLSSAPPLLVYGPGGMGKSTLMSKFILDYAELNENLRFPFVYLDFDRPGLIAEEPVTLLIEAARQLAVQYPRSKEIWEDGRKRWQETLASLEEDSPQQYPLNFPPPITSELEGNPQQPPFPTLPRILFYKGDITSEFVKMLEVTGISDKPFLLILDTFEEVQYRSRDFVRELWKFLDGFKMKHLQLSIIVAGRAPIDDFRTEALELSNLDAEAAQGYLQALGIADGDIAKKVAGQVGGNPLSLRLAAEVIKLEGAGQEGIRDLTTRCYFFLKVKECSIHGVLYKRILKHIHDPDVKRLAHPGLVLRRVTPDLIEKALAKPCGVKIKNKEHAERLFNELKKEVSLVTLSDDGSLRHRPDVRRVMIDLLRADEPDKVEQIHKKAVEFYEKLEGSVARAEEIYHRLSLGEETEKISVRWIEGVEEYLRSAIEELPPQAQTFLASRIGVELDEKIWRQAGLEDWERHAERRVNDLLKLRKKEEALSALRERTDRAPGSRLFLLEAEILEKLERFEEARLIAEKGINSTAEAGNGDILLDLLLLAARTDVYSENYQSAAERLVEARAVAEYIRNDIRLLEVSLQYLKLTNSGELQESSIESAAEAAIKEVSEVDKIIEAFNRTPDKLLSKHPKLFRETAGEIALWSVDKSSSKHLDVLKRTLRIVGLGRLADSQRDALFRAISNWDNQTGDPSFPAANSDLSGGSNSAWPEFTRIAGSAEWSKTLNQLLNAHQPTREVIIVLSSILRGQEPPHIWPHEMEEM